VLRTRKLEDAILRKMTIYLERGDFTSALFKLENRHPFLSLKSGERVIQSQCWLEEK